MEKNIMELLSYMITIVFVLLFLYHNNEKEKLKKKIDFYCKIGYILKLQRTLFLCKHVLELLRQNKKKTIKTEQILNILKEKGFNNYIDGNKFYYCDDLHFAFKENDHIDIFIYNFEKLEHTIRCNLGSINTNGFHFFLYLDPNESLELQVEKQDKRFMPRLPD